MASIATRPIQTTVIQPEVVLEQPGICPGHRGVTPVAALTGLAGVDLRLLVTLGAGAHLVSKGRAGVTVLASGFPVRAAKGVSLT